MNKNNGKKVVLNGRMTFIKVDIENLEDFDDEGISVLGLMEEYEERESRFTNKIIYRVDQLNILEYLKKELNISSYLSRQGKSLVSARYIVSDKPIIDAETVIADIAMSLEGNIELKHNSHFSDYTGYLWTDQELNIGGHNLLNELKSHLKTDNNFWAYRTYNECPEKYLWLEIFKHETK